MKKIIVSLIVLVVLVMPCYATWIYQEDFDDLSVGQYGNNITCCDGVSFFSEETAFLVITDGSYDRGHGIEHSLPNKLSVFNPPSDLWIQFDYPVNNVGFWLSGAYKTRTIYAYDSDDNEVVNYTQLYPMEEPLAPDGTPWDVYYDRQEYYINLQGDDITKVLIQAVGFDSFSIDDISAIPEPATFILLGLGTLFLRRRK